MAVHSGATGAMSSGWHKFWMQAAVSHSVQPPLLMFLQLTQLGKIASQWVAKFAQFTGCHFENSSVCDR
jgi:hypothetical protein